MESDLLRQAASSLTTAVTIHVPFRRDMVDSYRKDLKILLKNVWKLEKDLAKFEQVGQAFVLFSKNFRRLFLHQTFLDFIESAYEQYIWDAKGAKLESTVKKAQKFVQEYKTQTTMLVDNFLNYGESLVSKAHQARELIKESSIAHYPFLFDGMEEMAKVWGQSITRDESEWFKRFSPLLNWSQKLWSDQVGDHVNVQKVPEWVKIEGFDVLLTNHLEYGDKEASQYLVEVLRRFRQLVSKRAPLLLRHMPKLEADFDESPTFTNPRSGRQQGAAGLYYPGKRKIALYVPPRATNPAYMVSTLVHECGHHIYRTFLGDDQTALWSKAIQADVKPLNLQNLKDAWDTYGVHLGALELAGALKDVDPILSMQVTIIGYYNPPADTIANYGDLLKRMESNAKYSGFAKEYLIPMHPTTPYGSTDPEEAFCETLANLVTYGPRTVTDYVLDVFRTYTGRLVTASKVVTAEALRQAATALLWKEVYPASKAVHKYPDKWVHFSRIPKIGINPSPKKTHRDPPGVYFYPMSWIKDRMGWMKKQYGADFPHYFVCDLHLGGGKGIDLQGVTWEEVVELSDRNSWNDELNRITENLEVLENGPLGEIFVPAKYPGKFLWAATDYIANVSKKKTWLQMFKGVDWIADSEGLINRGEPQQVIVFKPSVIKVLEAGDNKPNVGRVVRNVLDKLRQDYGGTLAMKSGELALNMTIGEAPIRVIFRKDEYLVVQLVQDGWNVTQSMTFMADAMEDDGSMYRTIADHIKELVKRAKRVNKDEAYGPRWVDKFAQNVWADVPPMWKDRSPLTGGTSFQLSQFHGNHETRIDIEHTAGEEEGVIEAMIMIYQGGEKVRKKVYVSVSGGDKASPAEAAERFLKVFWDNFQSDMVPRLVKLGLSIEEAMSIPVFKRPFSYTSFKD